MFLTSNFCFWLNYESSIHNIPFSSEKGISSGEKYSMHRPNMFTNPKHLMDSFVTNTQLFTSQDVNRWMWDVWITCGFCDVFISCLDSHSDGTHSLQRIHWWASDVMLHFSKSVQMKKKNLIYILDSSRMSTLPTNFHFWVNYSFNELRIESWILWILYFP